MPIIDTTGIRPIERRQPTEGLERVRRRDDGGGGFRPQTNVNLKAAIQDIAATLGKIGTEEKTGLQRLPKEVGDVVKNILQQALSMESTLGKGIGSTIESQRFSMDQLVLFSRMLSQMGTLAERGYSMRLSEDTQTLMTQFKAALVAQEGGEALEPVLVSKAAFELVDAKVAEQLPQVLYEILSQLAQVSINAPQQQESSSDSMQFLKQLVKFYMPRQGVDVPTEDKSQQQTPNQQRGQTSSSFLNSLFRSFGGRAQAQPTSQAPQGQPQTFNQSQAPQGQPTTFNQPQAAQGQPTTFNQPQAAQGQPQTFNQPNAPQGQPQTFNQPNAPQGQPQTFNQPNAPQGQPTPFNQSQAPQGQPQTFNQSNAPQGQPQTFNQSNAPQGQPTTFNQSNAPQGQPQTFNQSQAAQGQPQTFNQPQAPQGQPQTFNQSQAPQGQPQMFNQPQAPQGQPQTFNQSQAPQGQPQTFNQSNAPQGQPTTFNQSQAPQGQPTTFNQSQAAQGQPQTFNQSQAPQGQPTTFNQSQAAQGQPQTFNQSQAPQGQPQMDPFSQLPDEAGQEPLDKDFVTRQKEMRHEMKAAKDAMIKQNLLNTPQTTDTMKNLAQFLLRNQQMTPRDAALLQNFVNNSQSTMSELEARHLQNLLRLCQQNVPLTVQQAAVQQKLPDLPRLWAFMQMCDLARVASNVNPKSYKRVGKDIAEFANAMRRAMTAENSVVQNQRSFQMMMPLYMGDDKTSYPTYLSIYDETARDEDTGEDKKETWLRICVLTDYIGAAELVFRIYDETKLDMRFYFSRQDVAEEFRSIYLDDLRESINKTPLNIGEVRVGGGSERMFSF